MPLQLYGWPTPLSFKDACVKNNYRAGKRFSIVIPTLNQADTLEHTLLSIIHQDYINIEIIVIDGGSNDGTERIIDQYKNWIDYYVSGEDSGQSDAINRGFSVATGDVYAWINSDDYYLPHAFSRISRVFESNFEIDIIVGSGDVITKECKFLKHINAMDMSKENLLRWLEGDWIMQQSCFWSGKIWEASGGVDPSLKLLMDFDLWLRFSKLGKCMLLNESLAAMRYYPEIKTVSLRDLVKEEIVYVLAKNGMFAEIRQIVKELVTVNKRLLTESTIKENLLSKRIFRRLGIEF
jgi:glycosyltransferase involved in cell wall biosynthesis